MINKKGMVVFKDGDKHIFTNAEEINGIKEAYLKEYPSLRFFFDLQMENNVDLNNKLYEFSVNLVKIGSPLNEKFKEFESGRALILNAEYGDSTHVVKGMPCTKEEDVVSCLSLKYFFNQDSYKLEMGEVTINGDNCPNLGCPCKTLKL